MFIISLFLVNTSVLPPPLSTSAVIDSNTVSGVRTRKSSTGSLDTLTSIAITAAVTTTSTGKYGQSLHVFNILHIFWSEENWLSVVSLVILYDGCLAWHHALVREALGWIGGCTWYKNVDIFIYIYRAIFSYIIFVIIMFKQWLMYCWSSKNYFQAELLTRSTLTFMNMEPHSIECELMLVVTDHIPYLWDLSNCSLIFTAAKLFHQVIWERTVVMKL